MKPRILLSLFLCSVANAQTITIEAESFVKQTHDDKRRWEIKKERPDYSGDSYIEVLPDTRVTHKDDIIDKENFSGKPGKVAVLHYSIQVPEPGRYYVWARTFSTGGEDNGLHFGLDDQWPESGGQWQTVQRNDWYWDCKQRTNEVTNGVPMQIWLDIDRPGKHTLMMSMREDGAEVDQIILSKSRDFRPDGVSYDDPQGSDKSLTAEVTRQPDGKGEISITGELKQWHKVTLSLNGPFAVENDEKPNPFTDLAFDVTFTHESGTPSYTVPGYFAADGNAANTSAESGTKWLAHLSPDKTGIWNYRVSFKKGPHAAFGGSGEAWKPFDGKTGTFTIEASDKTGRDFRSKGRLTYVGKHHLQFAGSKEYFLKAGPDSPETLLAYMDFDCVGKSEARQMKTWAPHRRDWKPGDPTWGNGRGKGLIGALNYLSAKGVNTFSFLTYNITGDGDNVWPFVRRDSKLHYDCSKLAQWGIVFDHATAHGLHLHFKLQENEMDDNRRNGKIGEIHASLDGGKLGPERKLYCREIIARFGHALALNWNIGEENTQSSEEIRDMVRYLHDTDPYDHHIVLHTFPGQQDDVYEPLLGDKSLLTGVSLQNSWSKVNEVTLEWLRLSAAAGRPWVVTNDEQNPAGLGIPPDPGYQGHDGIAVEKSKPKGSKAEGFISSKPYTMHDIRKHTLWGNLMVGGAGVEYYFGYSLPENDIECEDFRSRDQSWEYCRIALDFFREEKIPIAEMQSANALIGNLKDNNDKYCLAKPGELYLVYLPNGGSTELKAEGRYTLSWFNPRDGQSKASGDFNGKITAPDTNDWLAIIRRN